MYKNLTKYVPTEILSYLFGKLLGDANLSIETGKQPRFRFQHTYTDRLWCFHCFNILFPFLPFNPPKAKIVVDSRLSIGFSKSVYVQSKTHPLFTALKEAWYKDRKKIVPFDLLELIFSPATLSWWYQDDGYLKIKDNKLKKVILSTDNFSVEENRQLIEFIYKKFSFQFSIDGQNRLCLYDQPQILVFLEIVRPYLHSSMNRKNWTNNHFPVISKPKRTTIYLPIKYLILFPTSEIKQVIATIDCKEFIKDWFNSNYKLYIHYKEQPVLTKGYQVVLNLEEQNKLYTIQNFTGLRISDIIQFSYLYNNNRTSDC